MFTNLGRVYWLKVHTIPQAGRTAKGKAIVNLVQLKGGERIASVAAVREFDPNHYLLFVTNNDEPGVIGRICTLLGGHQVNIAEMHNVREQRGLGALTVIRTDEAINDDAIKNILADKAVAKTVAVILDA